MTVDEVNALRSTLARNGYFTVAIRSGGKRPVESGWTSKPAFRPASPGVLNTGIRTGREVFAIDIDCDEPTRAADTVRRVMSVLGETPLQRTRPNSPRLCLIYGAAEEHEKVTIKLGADLDGKRQQIELLGSGQQFVAFGKHETGADYEWLVQSPEEVHVDDLPRIEPKDIEALQAEFEADGGAETAIEDEKSEQKHSHRVVSSEFVPSPSSDNFFRSVNDAALAKLRAWVPELFPRAREKPAGVWRITSRSLGRNLQEDLSITSAGIQDFGLEEPRTAVDIVMEHGGASTAEEAALWLCELLGLNPESLGHRSERAQRAALAARGAEIAAGLAQSRAVKSVQDAAEEDLGDDDTDPFGDRFRDDLLLHPQGLIGDMADWIMRTAPRPNRPLAVAASIATVCGAISRTVIGPTAALTQLYIIGLGPSGSGKDRPLNAITDLLSAAGMGKLPTSFRITSTGAIDRLLASQPARVATIDEVGDTLFARMSSRNASTHEAGISSSLRTLWSVAINSQYEAASRASGGGERIHRPALTLYGTGTYDQVFRNLPASEFQNGFVNRLLMVEGVGPKPGEFQTVMPDDLTVPNAIRERLAALVLPRGYNGDMTGGVEAVTGLQAPGTVSVAWHDETAATLYRDFARDLSIWISDANTAMRSACYERAAEMAIRLATVSAVSRGGLSTTVRDIDVRWGIGVTLASARFLWREIQERWAETPFQRDCKAVLKLIRDAPDGMMTKTVLVRRLNHRFPKQDLDKIVQSLLDARHIVQWAQPSKTKFTKVYRFARNMAMKNEAA